MKETIPNLRPADVCVNCLHIRGAPYLNDHLYCSQYDSVVRYAALHTCDGFTSDNTTCDEE